MKGRSSLKLHILISLLLAVMTLIVFVRVLACGFVHDDGQYVLDNPAVRQGLSGQGIVWAFKVHASNWHPLTWLSLMLDAEVYGLKAWGFHLTNLLLHAANVILLFLVLSRMTGSVWKSAFAAALFAVHPLHVESVAWVAERKDVLSTLFGLLTIWAYVRYAEFKVQGSRFKVGAYLSVIVLFALCLMSKPMLVTLPFVLLLLDYWPLRRFDVGAKHLQETSVGGDSDPRMPAWSPKSGIGIPSYTARPENALPLLMEKIPLFLLAAGSSAVTWMAQHGTGAAMSLEHLPLSARIGNALVAYVSYPARMVWPRGLAAFYPLPGTDLAVWKAVIAGIVLLLVTLAVLRLGRRYPYAAMGWLWYLGTLVPVIGIVQVGRQAMADRYTYIPLIGLFMVLGWGLPEVVASARPTRPTSPIPPFSHFPILPITAVTALAAFMVCTYVQTGYWKNGVTLFTHAVRFTRQNAFAHTNLGAALMDANTKLAARHLRAAIRIEPRNPAAHANLAVLFEQDGRLNDAMEHYRVALRGDPNDPLAHYRMGSLLLRIGWTDEAAEHYSEAIRLDPGYADAHCSLGNLLARQGDTEEAIRHYRAAIRFAPSHVAAHMGLAIVLGDQGRLEEAEREYRRVIALDPRQAEAYGNLGTILMARRRYGEAIGYYRDALRANPDYATAWRNLAIALYFEGDYAGAWREVKLCRKQRIDLPPDFLRSLTARMPEP